MEYVQVAQNRVTEFQKFLGETDKTYDASAWPPWMKENVWIPYTAVSIYFVFVFTVPRLISKPLPGFRVLFGLWNLALSIFSTMGVLLMVPPTAMRVVDHGYFYTICERGSSSCTQGLLGFAVLCFTLSKIPELLDTVFLICLKKEVMFLHWYHHITVHIYSWHVTMNSDVVGLYFGAMNYTVHSIMYFYFFASTLCRNTWWFKTFLAPFAKYITLLQLAQMFGGIFLLSSGYYWKYIDTSRKCNMRDDTVIMGLAMYGSYFVLFAKLYYDSYIAKTRKNAAAKLAKEKAL